MSPRDIAEIAEDYVERNEANLYKELETVQQAGMHTSSVMAAAPVLHLGRGQNTVRGS